MESRQMNISSINLQILRKSFAVAATALTFACMTPCLTAHAAEAPAHGAGVAGAGIFGSVDLQKIESSYTKASDDNKILEQMRQQLSGVLQQEASYNMLSQDDQVELGTLLQKAAPTSTDTTTIQQLEQKSSQASQELTTLQSKPNPTDDDKTRMQQLLQLQQKDGPAALQAVQSDYQDQVQSKQNVLSAQITTDIKAAIASVAKKQGLAVVFDGAVAIYTTNDITDEVLQVLNK
jgi:Skp family chaperone for outer membrane proteins